MSPTKTSGRKYHPLTPHLKSSGTLGDVRQSSTAAAMNAVLELPVLLVPKVAMIRRPMNIRGTKRIPLLPLMNMLGAPFRANKSTIPAHSTCYGP
jgi:hypothetical protein